MKTINIFDIGRRRIVPKMEKGTNSIHFSSQKKINWTRSTSYINIIAYIQTAWMSRAGSFCFLTRIRFWVDGIHIFNRILATTPWWREGPGRHVFYVLVWWDPIHTKVQKLFSLEEWDFSLKYIIKVRWDEVSCKFTFWLSELNKRAKMGIKLLLWCLKR